MDDAGALSAHTDCECECERDGVCGWIDTGPVYTAWTYAQWNVINAVCVFVYALFKSVIMYDRYRDWKTYHRLLTL